MTPSTLNRFPVAVLGAVLAFTAGCSKPAAPFAALGAKAISNVVDDGAGAVEANASMAVDCGSTPCAELPFAGSVSSAALFDLFSTGDHQLGAFGQSVKFFVDGRESGAPRTFYMNGNFTVDGERPESAELHYRFAQAYLAIPEPPMDYNLVTYFTNEKRYFAGTVQRYHLDSEGGADVYGVQFFPQDVISGATILKALDLVQATFKVADARLAFVVTGQQQDVTSIADDLAARGVRLLTIEDVLGSLDFLGLNAGEFGYLRLFPKSQDDLRPTDIPVFDELPLDLAVVAGVITKAYQDPNSHVNLKSRERGTPNMMLRTAAIDADELAPYADKPVHLVVRADGWTIEPSTDEVIKAKLKARLARPWTTMTIPKEDRLLAYDEMCIDAAADCLALKTSYGAKAANLGFLAHPYVLGRADQSGTLSAQLGYDVTPHGFGVPIYWYKRFVENEANAPVRKAIDAVIAAERAGDVSPADRRRLAQATRLAILAGAVPEAMATAIRGRVADTLGDKKRLKIRSSANAEDISGFNGAGLYDSFLANPALPADPAGDMPCTVEHKMNKRGTVRAKVYPATLECAVKATWASLWNERAISERSFARLGHENAAMGLAIVEAYDIGADIDANAVIVTRVPNTDTLSGYSLSTHEKNNLVTNPAPGTWSELAIAVLLTDDVPTSLTILRHAKSKIDAPERDGAVLSKEKMLTMVEIAKTVELAWCRADVTYYPLAPGDGKDCHWTLWDDKKPKALDFELKLRADGKFVAKQVRPFTGGH